ncbi:MAG: hypothetical protein R3C11_27680 [Planctomycetaceae bacterium]
MISFVALQLSPKFEYRKVRHTYRPEDSFMGILWRDLLTIEVHNENDDAEHVKPITQYHALFIILNEYRPFPPKIVELPWVNYFVKKRENTPMSEKKRVNLHWYGERGIVNSLITHVASLRVEGVQELLSKIEWGDPSQNEWIKDLKSVEILVEIGLAQFGDPDLIFVCKTKSGEFYTIIMEVKATTYLASALQGGRSRIQRQLELKYRFARSLAGRKKDDPVSESKMLHKAYMHRPQAYKLEKETKHPRKLSKQRVINLCQKTNLFKTSFDNFRFVAWTWDQEAFFHPGNVESQEYLPKFLQEDQTENWEWSQRRIGWLGYYSIERQSSFDNEAYKNAVSTMLPSKHPQVIKRGSSGVVTSINIEENFSDRTQLALAELQELANEYFIGKKMKSHKGSYSMRSRFSPIEKSKVLLKIIPKKKGRVQKILLGVSTVLERDCWGGIDSDYTARFGKQEFFFWELPNHSDKAREIVTPIFEELAEVLEIQQV